MPLMEYIIRHELEEYLGEVEEGGRKKGSGRYLKGIIEISQDMSCIEISTIAG